MLEAGTRYADAIIQRQPPHWLTMWGRNGAGNGTGKTYLANLIADRVRLHLPGAVPVRRLNWPDLCCRWQAREDIGHKIAMAREAALLIIDDAGAENQSVATVSLLQTLLNSRLKQWTIITTNLSPTDWAERDARVASRMRRDGSWVLRCETTDYALRPKA